MISKLTLSFILALIFVASLSAGPYYDVWYDLDNDGNKDFLLGKVTAFEGTRTAWDNYNYYSASAHPFDGPTPEAYKSKMYFYDGDDGLSFGFFHNVDDGGNNYWNYVRWSLEFSGIDPTLAGVDDQGDWGIMDMGFGLWEARWSYILNTDGGAFLLDPAASYWEIHIDPAYFGDIQDWQMYSGDGSYLNLWHNPTPPPTNLNPEQHYEVRTNAYTTIITSHIPEPATLILLGIGLLGARFVIRRRR